MAFKKLFFSLAYLTVSAIAFASEPEVPSNLSQASSTTQEQHKFFSLEEVLKDQRFNEFYNFLSKEDQANFNILIEELNNLSSSIISNLNETLKTYKDLLVKYKEFKNVEKLKFFLSFSLEDVNSTDSRDNRKVSDHPETREFYKTLTPEEQIQIDNLLVELEQACDKAKNNIISLFNSCQSLKTKFKEFCGDNNAVMIRVGFDSPLPLLTAAL